MKDALTPSHAQARSENLITRELDGEILVYDLDDDRALCLSPLCAHVWEACDGGTPPSGLVEHLRASGYQDADERAVWVALDRLSRLRLLETPVRVPAQALGGVSRRNVLRSLGTAAAVPLVSIVTAPAAAQVVSCSPQFGPCTTAADCCVGPCPTGLGFCVQGP